MHQTKTTRRIHLERRTSSWRVTFDHPPLNIFGPASIHKTPAQVLLAWAIQRGTALLTTSKTPSRIKENFEVSTLPEEVEREISEGIKLRVRFNAVVETGIPGFIPRGECG